MSHKQQKLKISQPLQKKIIEPYGLNIEETNDNIIVTGVVDTLSEKIKIAREFNDIATTKKLDLAISISTDGAINEKDVAMEVAEEIEAYPDLKGKITTEVDKGVVHLKGEVENREYKKKAVYAASKARGVTDVVDEINVKNKIDEPEDIFHSQVRNDKEKN